VITNLNRFKADDSVLLNGIENVPKTSRITYYTDKLAASKQGLDLIK
jgi:hypothetical protein